MKVVLQVALDLLNGHRALLIAKDSVAGGVDFLEAGTPLIKSEGMDIVRKLKDRLLVRQCVKILAKVKQIANNKINDSHRSYLELWKILQSEDKDLRLMFDDVK